MCFGLGEELAGSSDRLASVLGGTSYEYLQHNSEELCRHSGRGANYSSCYAQSTSIYRHILVVLLNRQLVSQADSLVNELVGTTLRLSRNTIGHAYVDRTIAFHVHNLCGHLYEDYTLFYE